MFPPSLYHSKDGSATPIEGERVFMIKNETQQTIPRMRTLPKLHRELNEMGIEISMNALRVWVKQGKIPAIYVGKKALVNMDAVIDYLNGGTHND
jgi:hypothetical protein